MLDNGSYNCCQCFLGLQITSEFYLFDFTLHSMSTFSEDFVLFYSIIMLENTKWSGTHCIIAAVKQSATWLTQMENREWGCCWLHRRRGAMWREGIKFTRWDSRRMDKVERELGSAMCVCVCVSRLCNWKKTVNRLWGDHRRELYLYHA